MVNRTDDFFDLNLLFETNDENDEFFGFDVPIRNASATFPDLVQIFNTSASDDDFVGFNNASRNTDLNSLFSDDSHDNEFFGF